MAREEAEMATGGRARSLTTVQCGATMYCKPLVYGGFGTLDMRKELSGTVSGRFLASF